MQDSTQQIPLTLIYARQNNRETFDPVKLQLLADDIKANGLLQPIGVEPDGNGRYSLIWGERRYRAALLAGLETINAVVKTGLSRLKSLMATVKENDNREQTNSVEQAKGYRALLDLGATAKEIAQEIGKNSKYVQDRLNLLELRPDVQKLVADGGLGISYANCMLGLDTNRQRIAIDTYNAQGAIRSVQWYAAVCGQLMAQQAQDSLFSWGYGEDGTAVAPPVRVTMPLDPAQYRPSFNPSDMHGSVTAELERWQVAADGWRQYGKANKVESCQAIIATLGALLAVLPAGVGSAVATSGEDETAVKIQKLLRRAGGEATTRELTQYANRTAVEVRAALAGLVESGRVAHRRSGRGERWALVN